MTENEIKLQELIGYYEDDVNAMVSTVIENPDLWKDFLSELRRDKALQIRVRLRTKFLNSGKKTFDEHYDNLQKKFPATDWNKKPDCRAFNVARIIKEMINFELYENKKIVEIEKKRVKKTK